MTKVLITGGTGMIGAPLTELLLKEGYEVIHLSRSVTGKESVPTFSWNLDTKQIDARAFEGIESIIHLAGAGIADKPWNPSRKQEIIDSRVDTAKMLLDGCNKNNINLKNFISASAIGYYPLTISDLLFKEDSPSGNGFLAEVCKKWEDAADDFKTVAKNVSKIRIGLVLGKDQGALKQIALPVKYYAAAGLGKGHQSMAWIHVQDVSRVFAHALKNNLNGAFNAVGPEIVSNQDFMQILADVMEKPLLLPNVPEFLIKLVFGEKSDLILKGVKLSSKKIQSTGFDFDYPTLNSALMQIYND